MDDLPLELQLTIYETVLKDTIYEKIDPEDEEDTPEIEELLAGSRIIANLCKTSQALNCVASRILEKHVASFYDLLSHVLCYATRNGDYETFSKFRRFLMISDEWKENTGAYWKTFTAVNEEHSLDALISNVREELIGERNATSVFNREIMADLMQLSMSEENEEDNQDEIISLFCNLFSRPYITSEDCSHFFKTACNSSKISPSDFLERITKTDDKGENVYWNSHKNTMIRSLASIDFLLSIHSTANLTALLTNAISNGSEDVTKRLLSLSNTTVTPTMLTLSTNHLSTLRLLALTPSDIQTALTAALESPTTIPLQNVLTHISTFSGDTNFTLTPSFTSLAWSPLLYTDRHFPRKREQKANSLIYSGFQLPTTDPKSFLDAYFTPGPSTTFIILEHIQSGARYSLDTLRPEDFILGCISSRGPCDLKVLSLCHDYLAPITFNLLSQSIILGDSAEYMHPRNRIATTLVLLDRIEDNDVPDEVAKVLMQMVDWMQDNRGLMEGDWILTRKLIEKVWGVANDGTAGGSMLMGVEGKRRYERWWRERGSGIVEMVNLSLMVKGEEGVLEEGEEGVLEKRAWRGDGDGGLPGEEGEDKDTAMASADGQEGQDPGAIEAEV